MIKILTRFFKSTRITAVFSVLLAIVGWYVVVYSISPLDDKEIFGVGAAVSLSSGTSLNIIGIEDISFDVKIEGFRYNIGNLQAEDILLYADTANVIRPGEYDLTIMPVVNENTKYTVVEIVPETIKISVDRQTSIAVPVSYSSQNLEVPEEGYILGETSIYPETIVVTGPESELMLIEKAVATRTFYEPITSQQDFFAAITLYNKDGERVKTADDDPNSYIYTDYNDVKVDITVLEVVQLPLTISFINVPDDFPIEDFRYTMSNNTIEVAATAETLSRYYEVSLGHIDVSQLDLTTDSSVTFDVQLPSNIMNSHFMESVVVNFEMGDLEEKRLNVGNLVLINTPPDYNIRIMTTAINNVKFIGDSEAIEALTAEDVVAEMDFALLDVELGQYQVPVTIQTLGEDLIWAVGKYQVVISVQVE